MSGSRLRIPAGLRATLQRGVGRLVPLPRQPNGLPLEALVLMDEDRNVRAYVNRCQHLPIPLDGGSGRFFSDDGKFLVCGTHGARYRPQDGICVEGPCIGRGLEVLDVELDGDAIFVLFSP